LDAARIVRAHRLVPTGVSIANPAGNEIDRVPGATGAGINS
jgi:hypothetical protein